MSNYHSRIMNIPVPLPTTSAVLTSHEFIVYKYGHSDARHVAAEIALEAQNEISKLQAECAELRERLRAAEVAYNVSHESNVK